MQQVTVLMPNAVCSRNQETALAQPPVPHVRLFPSCRPVPGNHGSLTLYYARITDIAVGVCIVLLFDLVIPWCALTPCSNLSTQMNANSVRTDTCVNARTRPPDSPFLAVQQLEGEEGQLLVNQDLLCLRVMLPACRYASADALEKLGVVYREATGLLQEYYGCFVDETRLAGKGTAMIEGETGVAALEKDMLQKKIARPLSEYLPAVPGIA